MITPASATTPAFSAAPVALITGAAHRLGAHIARRLHACGCNVIIHYRTSEVDALALATELTAIRPDSAFALATALDDVEACASLIEAAAKYWQRLDVLINNASSFYPTPLGSIRAEDWQRLTASNLFAPLFLTQAAAPFLRVSPCTGGAVVVNITDVHAERPLPGYPLYCAAKAGLLGLTRALAVEMAPQVRVNAVAPGPVLWPERGDYFPPTLQKAIVAQTLLKRCGSPEDIARAVEYLVFAAPYITGQTLTVDGGRTTALIAGQEDMTGH